MILSHNFSLHEMTRSGTARELHIDNSLNPNQESDQIIITNLMSLALYVLQPLRDMHGPISINSGYRCPELNARVGGVVSSEHICKHMRAAADIRSSSLTALDLFESIILHNLPYRTVILERRMSSNGYLSEWVHVSFCRGQSKPRRKNMIIDKILGVKESYPYPEILSTLNSLYKRDNQCPSS